MGNRTKTKDLVQQGIISQAQADQIEQYENSIASAKNSWWIVGFYILGALIISLGLISLIAANWSNIPANMKLLSNFIILSVLALYIFKAFEEQNIIKFDILILTLILFCMASIGLISQIYNLRGQLYEPLLFWSAITFLIVTRTQRHFTWLIWLSALFFGTLSLLYNKYAWIFENVQNAPLNITYLFAFLMFVNRQLSGNPGLKAALRDWGIFSLIFTVIAIESMTNFGTSFSLPENIVHKAIVVDLPTITTFILAMLSVWNAEFFNRIQKHIAYAIIVLLLISNILASTLHLSNFIPAIFTLATFAVCAILAASMHLNRVFNLFLVCIGIRCVILYFQALGGLAATGAGLMIAGIIIIYLAVMWHRYGSELLKKIERWADAEK